MVLERREEPAVEVGDFATFRKVVRALFAQRRKMARSALKSLHENPSDLLTELGLNPSTRGERFTLEELAMISRAL